MANINGKIGSFLFDLDMKQVQSVNDSHANSSKSGKYRFAVPTFLSWLNRASGGDIVKFSLKNSKSSQQLYKSFVGAMSSVGCEKKDFFITETIGSIADYLAYKRKIRQLELIRDLNEQKIQSSKIVEDSSFELSPYYLIVSYAKDKLLKLSRTPKFVGAFVDISNVSNFPCSSFLNREVEHGDGVTWGYERMKAVIQLLSPYTNMFYISGGEPFMNKDLVRILEDNSDKPFVVFTDGTQVEEYQKVIDKDLKNVAFVVTVDEPKKGAVDNFDQAMESIKHIRESGFICGVSTVVDPDNIQYVFKREYHELLKTCDASFLCYLRDFTQNNPDFIEEYENNVNMEEKDAGEVIPTFSMPDSEPTLSGRDCIGGDAVFHLKVNGDVGSCPIAVNYCGNVFSNGIAHALEKLSTVPCECSYRKNK